MKKISAESEKPVFIKCSEYETTILEGLKVGTVVLEVAATVNNVDVVDIEYTLLSNNRFKIDVISGQITTNYVFDRDVPKNEKEEIIRVCATFKKDPKLKGFCDIKIVIDDVNDNLPTFQQNEFHKDLLINSKINEMIFKIEATDIDDEENSKIGYELYSDLLRVDNSGAIFLKNIVDKKPGEFYLVTLRAFNTNNPLNFTECYINFRVINENVFIPSITLPQSTESFTSSNVIIVDKNPSTLSQSTKSTNDQTTDKTTLLVNNINTEADKVKHDSNNGTQKDDITTSIRKKIIGYVMKDYNLIVICVITVIIIINLWVCCCCCRKTKRVSHDFISNDDSLYFNENDKRNYFEMVERTTNSYGKYIKC